MKATLPRLALGTIQPDVDLQPVLWSLLEVLRRLELQCQVFYSQSRFVPADGSLIVSGKRQRHLDSWLMSPEISRQAFMLGSYGNDLSLVTGSFAASHAKGGSLTTLCQWLDLPKIAIVDVSRLSACRIPQFPSDLSGILLDRVESDDQYVYWQTCLESLVKCPVVGGLGTCAAERRQVGPRPANQTDSPMRRDACCTLGASLGRYLRLDRLLNMAEREFSPAQHHPHSLPRFPLNVALAYDEAFHCYFPDMLDALELMGGKLRDFSPLRSDRLPDKTDLVLFGCGRPDQYAEKLARNCCIKQSLLQYVRKGGRVYAEGGGLAYACQGLVERDQLHSMAGLLPAVAYQANPGQDPVEISLSTDSWLGRKGTSFRGYSNSLWRLRPTGVMNDLLAPSAYPLHLVQSRRVIGSRIHIHFSSYPELLRHLLSPLRAAV